MIFNLEANVNQPIIFNGNRDISLYIKREDEIHPYVSGNKFRKLKYNLLEAKKLKNDTLLTFGGAFSNHILAVAWAGQYFGFKTIGIIRGEELQNNFKSNPTLNFAQQCGMQFKFVTREVFRTKNSEGLLNELKHDYGDYYLIPEGGTNTLAIKGCEEILTEKDDGFDFVCCSVGTGGTFSGLINGSKPHQKILGFPALKGDFLQEDISKFVAKTNWELITGYDFGGYAKINKVLICFINSFKSDYQILLDPVYTGKMMFGVFDLIQKNYFPNGSKILAIHTGGIQGIKGMNTILKKKNLPLIE